MVSSDRRARDDMRLRTDWRARPQSTGASTTGSPATPHAHATPNTNYTLKTPVSLPAVPAAAAGLQVSERRGVVTRYRQDDGAGVVTSLRTDSAKRTGEADSRSGRAKQRVPVVASTIGLREIDGLRRALAS